MHESIQEYKDIINIIKSKLENQKNIKFPNIIAVSKTFKIEKITPLINHGHLDFGENKVQEAQEKWTDIKIKNTKIKLHLIGRLQTNKVKFAIKIFDFIHSLDSLKLAKKISEEEIKQNKKVKLFIQVNIGDEDQKSGVNKNVLGELITYCKDLNLDIIGLMCIPPVDKEPSKYFEETKLLSQKFNLSELSMGMSSDYLTAIEYSSTYLRIGSGIFGKRS